MKYACSSKDIISQNTVKAFYNLDINNYAPVQCDNCIKKPQLFLNKLTPNQWKVTSFDSHNRTVCFDVTNKVNIVTHVSYTLPNLSSKSWASR